MKRKIHTFITVLFVVTAPHIHAGSATWKSNPVSNDWNNPANWSPNTVPNGPADVATFMASSVTDISIPGTVELDTMFFDFNTSPSYTFTLIPAAGEASLIFSGGGISMGVDTPTQNFVVSTDAAGGHSTITFEDGTYVNGNPSFFIQANPVVGQPGGMILFRGDADAGLGLYTVDGSIVSGGSPGEVHFLGASRLQYAGIINNGSNVAGGVGGSTFLHDQCFAFAPDLTANGGTNGGGGGRIVVADDSLTESGDVYVYGNGVLDMSGHTGSGVYFLNIDGDGLVLLGPEMEVTRGNFAGVIQDGAPDQPGSVSLRNGKLTLSGANTYSGGTALNSYGGESPTLTLAATNGSATGSGTVIAYAGTLKGAGTIDGAVVIGGDNSDDDPAYLEPGLNGPRNLKIQKRLRFKSDGVYNWELQTATRKASSVRARDVVIDAGAQFVCLARGTEPLPIGSMFRVMDVDSDAPISGTFANLPDGGTITVGNNTFQANYEGGDGDDLTLTVVP